MSKARFTEEFKIAAIKGFTGKALTPERRGEAAHHLVQSGSLSISQACRLTRLSRHSWYRPDPVLRRLE